MLKVEKVVTTMALDIISFQTISGDCLKSLSCNKIFMLPQIQIFIWKHASFSQAKTQEGCKTIHKKLNCCKIIKCRQTKLACPQLCLAK